VQRDVDEGREHLNFSNWNQNQEEHDSEADEVDELGETVLEGKMPMANYLLTHPAALAAGLLATAARTPAR